MMNAFDLTDLTADTVSAMLLEAETDADPSNPVQQEMLALLRRFVALMERGRVLVREQMAITEEVNAIAGRMASIGAGAALAPAMKQ
jgi:hypothetical protein